MKVLFLGNNNLSKSLSDWLISVGEEVILIKEKIEIDFVKMIEPELIVSYNYRHVILKEVIEFMKGKIINLHISYLPYNKGAHPNVWSFIEDTPKGVTIHYIDEGIDTGDIILQKRVFFNEKVETLKSSYATLHRKIQALFKDNWEKIKRGEIRPKENQGGTIHFKSELSFLEPVIEEKGWDIPINNLREVYNDKKVNG